MKYQEIDVTNDASGFERMRQLTGRDTVPQLLVDGKHIGGCDELHALERLGRLDAALGE